MTKITETKKKQVKAFTLVELLGTIVIIGILSAVAISAVSKLISNARVSSSEANIKTMKMAAESYVQSNANLLPKNIGEYKNIDINELKQSKYITSDLVDSKGNSCMKYSYVRVYKLSKNEYTYTPYLYCGDETPENTEKGKKPFAILSFSDSKVVTKASFSLKIYGDDTKSGDKYIPETEIESYSYSISAKLNKENTPTEIYNSGTLSANRKKSIILNKNFSDYIDVSGVSTFYVEVTVINVTGETYTISSSTSSSNSQTYIDDVAPLCNYDHTVEPAADEWINKNSNSSERVISVGCDDGDGSGCKRANFSKSWPYDENGDGNISDEEKGVEFGYIAIYDNRDEKFSGNKETGNRGIDTREPHNGKTDCRVRVNVDLVSPSATLIAKSRNKTVLNAVTVNDKKEITTILSDSYSNLVGQSKSKWMNNANYSQGVTYEVEVSDNLHLDHWTWNTNAAYLNDDATDDLITHVSDSGPDSDRDSFKQPDLNTNDKGNRKDKITFGFKTEGRRYGVLTIYDAAGNSVSYKIYANLDRTAPKTPTFDAENIENKTQYIFDTWSNDSTGVLVYATGTGLDNESNNTNLSGHKTYKYKVNGGSFVGGDKYTVSVQGKTAITFIACDYAGNCSDEATIKNVYLDNIAPKCNVSVASEKNSNYNGEWTNVPVTVSAECKDADGGSGCVTKPFSKTYTEDIKTSKAGAIGDNNPGSVSDAAGNVTTCDTVKVQIDKVEPTCTVSGGKDSWTNKSITITATCTDNGSVKSECKQTSKKLVYPDDIEGANEFNTTQAGVGGVGVGGYVEDNAGNIGKCAANQTVRIDKTAPKCEVTGETTSWSTSKVTVKAHCVEQGSYQSGCVTNDFSNGYSNVDISDAGAISRGNGGIVKDAAGNSASCKTVKVMSDTTTPKVTSCSHNKNKFTVGQKSVGISGLSEYQFKVNDSPKKASSSSSYSVSSACGEKSYNVKVRIKNGAGTWSGYKDCGTYTSPKCCSSSSYLGCDWTTSCRDGNTFVYTDASLSVHAGVVRHGSINDKLYVIEVGNKWVKVHPESYGEDYKNHGDDVYIYSNCINVDSNGNLKNKNAVCEYSNCPG